MRNILMRNMSRNSIAKNIVGYASLFALVIFDILENMIKFNSISQ